MPNRGKVMRGLEYCFALGCDAKCPYIKEPTCTRMLLQDAFALLKEQKPQSMTFRVIDPKTGKEPIYDGNHIGKGKWFRDSYWNPRMIDEWIITESGQLGLMDRSGQTTYPPPGRFEVIWDGGDGDD